MARRTWSSLVTAIRSLLADKRRPQLVLTGSRWQYTDHPRRPTTEASPTQSWKLPAPQNSESVPKEEPHDNDWPAWPEARTTGDLAARTGAIPGWTPSARSKEALFQPELEAEWLRRLGAARLRTARMLALWGWNAYIDEVESELRDGRSREAQHWRRAYPAESPGPLEWRDRN